MNTIEKTCFKCLRLLPITDFYKHKFMADGHLNKCKDCTKRDVALHRSENIEKVRGYDRVRAEQPHRVALRRRVVAEYSAKHPDRVKANNAVTNAVRDGRLVKPEACWHCGSTRGVGGHHASYHPTMRLAVSWLCQACHKEVHRMTAELLGVAA